MTKSEFKRLNTEYQATVYSATTPDGILLIRPGRRNHLLDNVLNAFRAKRWAFITAYNPGSIPMSDAINEAAHIELCRMLMRKGLVSVQAMRPKRMMGGCRRCRPRTRRAGFGIHDDRAGNRVRRYHW